MIRAAAVAVAGAAAADEDADATTGVCDNGGDVVSVLLVVVDVVGKLYFPIGKKKEQDIIDLFYYYYVYLF